MAEQIRDGICYVYEMDINDTSDNIEDKGSYYYKRDPNYPSKMISENLMIKLLYDDPFIDTTTERDELDPKVKPKSILKQVYRKAEKTRNT